MTDWTTLDYAARRRLEHLRDRLARGFARDLLFAHLGHTGLDEGAEASVARAYALADAVLAERDRDSSI